MLRSSCNDCVTGKEHALHRRGMFTNLVDNKEDALRGTAAGLLTRGRLSQIWPKTHPSRANDDKIHELAHKIADPAYSFDDNPELLIFTRALIGIERQSLRGDDAESQEFRRYLDGAEDYIRSLPKGNGRVRDLPEQYQEFLDLIADDRGQLPLRPIHNTWKLAKDWGGHLWNETKKHPYAATAFLATSLGLLTLIQSRLGNKALYMDVPRVMDLDSAFPDDPSALTQAPLVAREDLMRICHSHLEALFGKTASEYMRSTFESSDFLLQHCPRFKTLSDDATSLYDGFYARFEPLIRGPATALADVMPAGSDFKTTFATYANMHANMVYRADFIENFVVHGCLFVAAHGATVALGSQNREQLGKLGNDVSDFFRRTLKNRKLNYLASVAGGAVVYGMNDYSFTPLILWGAVFGGVIGEKAHDIINRFKAPEAAKADLLTVRKDLAIFSNPSSIISAAPAGQTAAPEQEPTSWYSVRKSVKNSALGGIALVGAMDLAAHGGQATAAVLSGAVVWGTYLFVNIPQDAALHAFFIALGITTGTIHLAAQKGLKWGAKHIGFGESDHQPR